MRFRPSVRPLLSRLPNHAKTSDSQCVIVVASRDRSGTSYASTSRYQPTSARFAVRRSAHLKVAQDFLDDPRALELERVVGVERGLEPFLRVFGEPLGGAQQVAALPIERIANMAPMAGEARPTHLPAVVRDD